MKISLKLILYKQKTYSDGTHPIMLQYIIDRKTKRKVIAKCKVEDWDDKAKRLKSRVSNSARINHFLSTEFAKAEKDLYDIKSGEMSGSSLFKTDSPITLDEALKAELIRLKEDFKPASYDKILALSNLIPNASIYLAHMDERWFNKFIADLEQKSNPNSGTTIKKKVKTLRGLIARYSSSGVSKEVKDIHVKSLKAIKQKLTREEFSAIENLILPEDDLLTATRDLFLLQVYLRGIRVGDLLRADISDFKDGRFFYRSSKVDKAMDMKIIPKAQDIIDKYKGKHSKLFPFYNWIPDPKLSEFENKRKESKHKETCTTIINRYLKVIATMAGIKKPLSSHIARHTYARMAIDTINNPMITMDLLGHSSLAVHQSYVEDIRKDDDLDKASDEIFK